MNPALRKKANVFRLLEIRATGFAGRSFRVGKAVLKTRAVQTLRDCRASLQRTKRLECVRFIGAFRQGAGRRRFMVPMRGIEVVGLSMTRTHIEQQAFAADCDQFTLQSGPGSA